MQRLGTRTAGLAKMVKTLGAAHGENQTGAG